MDDSSHLGPDAHDNSVPAESAGDEARLGELRAAVARGLEDIKAGLVVDLEEAFGRIEAMLDELEAAKRSAA